MKRVAMVLALLIGMPVPASAAASLSSLSRSPAPEAIPPRIAPKPIKLVPIPPRPTEPPPSTDVPLPPQPVAPPPSEAPAPTVVGPVAPPPTAEPPTTEAPATTEPTTTEPPPAVATKPPTPEPAPLSRPLVVRRPPEPLVILDPPPPPGTGMRVGGGILLGLGTLNTISGGILTALGDKDERPFGIARLALGVAELGSGVVLVVHGLRRARRLAAWKATNNDPVPKTGNGMLVGGAMLVGVGLYDGLGAAVFVQQTNEVPVGTVVIAATEVVMGAVLLVLGSARKRRYQRWEHDSFAFAGPSVTSLPGGGALAMRGRF